MSNSILDNPDGRISWAQNSPLFQLSHETTDRVMTFLKAHPERCEAVGEKLNQAVVDILAQEENEIGIQACWKVRWS